MTVPPAPARHRTQDLDTALTEALDRHSRGGRVALVDDRDGRVLTYQDLAAAVTRTAAELRALGPGGRSGDPATVAICADKGVDAVVGVLAALRTGLCVCVLEPDGTAEVLARRVVEFGVDRVLAGPEQLRRLATGLADRVVALPSPRPGPSPPPIPTGPAEPQRAALMLFTSGSTGAPKAIRLTGSHLVPHALGVVSHTGLTPEDRLLHLMPLHHTNGINNQIIAPLLAGASVVLVRRFDATAVEAQIDRYRPTVLTAVPTMYLRMLGHLDRRRDRPTLRMLRCGSAPLTPSQHEQIENAFGVPLIQSYGLSEATCTSVMNPPDAPRRGSVGTVLAHQQVRILSAADGTELAPGQEGEICIGGPTVMSGYWGATPDDGPVRDGLLHTGDLGTLDADGYLRITGRLKDVIIRGGENLSPAAIESALTTHPGVSDAAVVGAPHPDLGEVPVAFVIASDPATTTDPEDLRDHVRHTVGRIHTPHHVEFVAALPLNPVGKVDKKALRRALPTAST